MDLPPQRPHRVRRARPGDGLRPEHELHRRLPPPRRLGRGGRVLVPHRARRPRGPRVLQRGHGRREARSARVRPPAPRAPPRRRTPPRVPRARRHRHRHHLLAVAPHPLRQRPPRPRHDARLGPRLRRARSCTALRRVHSPLRAQRRRRPRRGRHGRGDRTPAGTRRRRLVGRSLRRRFRRSRRRAPRRRHRARQTLEGDGEGTRSMQTTERCRVARTRAHDVAGE